LLRISSHLLRSLTDLRLGEDEGAQKASQVVSLNRANDGHWFARKGIPEDLRQKHAR
jgi:hypothetical protein